MIFVDKGNKNYMKDINNASEDISKKENNNDQDNTNKEKNTDSTSIYSSKEHKIASNESLMNDSLSKMENFGNNPKIKCLKKESSDSNLVNYDGNNSKMNTFNFSDKKQTNLENKEESYDEKTEIANSENLTIKNILEDKKDLCIDKNSPEYGLNQNEPSIEKEIKDLDTENKKVENEKYISNSSKNNNILTKNNFKNDLNDINPQKILNNNKNKPTDNKKDITNDHLNDTNDFFGLFSKEDKKYIQTGDSNDSSSYHYENFTDKVLDDNKKNRNIDYSSSTCSIERYINNLLSDTITDSSFDENIDKSKNIQSNVTDNEFSSDENSEKSENIQSVFKNDGFSSNKNDMNINLNDYKNNESDSLDKKYSSNNSLIENDNRSDYINNKIDTTYKKNDKHVSDNKRKYFQYNGSNWYFYKNSSEDRNEYSDDIDISYKNDKHKFISRENKSEDHSKSISKNNNAKNSVIDCSRSSSSVEKSCNNNQISNFNSDKICTKNLSNNTFRLKSDSDSNNTKNSRNIYSDSHINKSEKNSNKDSLLNEIEDSSDDDDFNDISNLINELVNKVRSQNDKNENIDLLNKKENSTNLDNIDFSSEKNQTGKESLDDSIHKNTKHLDHILLNHKNKLINKLKLLNSNDEYKYLNDNLDLDLSINKNENLDLSINEIKNKKTILEIKDTKIKSNKKLDENSEYNEKEIDNVELNDNEAVNQETKNKIVQVSTSFPERKETEEMNILLRKHFSTEELYQNYVESCSCDNESDSDTSNENYKRRKIEKIEENIIQKNIDNRSKEITPNKSYLEKINMKDEDNEKKDKNVIVLDLSSDLEESSDLDTSKYPLEILNLMNKPTRSRKEIHNLISFFLSQRVIQNKYNIKIYRNDYETLVGRSWLNDKIINMYFSLLIEYRNKEAKKTYKNIKNIKDKNLDASDIYWKIANGDPLCSKIMATNTFFYTILKKKGENYILENWFKNIDISSFDEIIIPINIPAHWIFAHVNIKLKEIKVYDSLGFSRKPVGVRIGLWIKKYMENHTNSIDSTFTVLDGRNIPRQKNGNDCGVFVCYFARCIVLNRKIEGKRANAEVFRKIMMHEIAAGKILYTVNKDENE